MNIYLVSILNRGSYECSQITEAHEYEMMDCILDDQNPFVVDAFVSGIHAFGHQDVYVRAKDADTAIQTAVEAVADAEMILLGRSGYYGRKLEA